MSQVEQLKQQTLTTLTEKDQQLRQLTAMLEETRAQKPKLQQERFQREVGLKSLAYVSNCAITEKTNRVDNS